MDTVDWLLDSDPAIGWQVMRDLTPWAGGADSSPAEITAERARVAREGLGAEILARQESDGPATGQIFILTIRFQRLKPVFPWVDL